MTVGIFATESSREAVPDAVRAACERAKRRCLWVEGMMGVWRGKAWGQSFCTRGMRWGGVTMKGLSLRLGMRVERIWCVFPKMGRSLWISWVRDPGRYAMGMSESEMR